VAPSWAAVTGATDDEKAPAAVVGAAFVVGAAAAFVAPPAAPPPVDPVSPGALLSGPPPGSAPLGAAAGPCEAAGVGMGLAAGGFGDEAPGGATGWLPAAGCAETPVEPQAVAPSPATNSAVPAAPSVRAGRRYHERGGDTRLDMNPQPTSRLRARRITALVGALVVLGAGCGAAGHRAAPVVVPAAGSSSGRTSVGSDGTAGLGGSATALGTATTAPGGGSATATTSLSVPAVSTPSATAAPRSAPPSAAPTTSAVVATTGAPSCPANLPGGLASTGSAGQLIVVEASGYGTVSATVTLWQRQGPCWVAAGGPWPAYLGANGFSDHHREGDDTTPTGLYAIGPVMYGNAADPGVAYPYHQLVCGDWWDEDPSSPGYNTFQHVACGQTPPFAGGSEALWQETAPYPSFAVVDYNTAPAVAGAGSGIFIHASTGGPTAGCVSLPLADLDALLRWLSPGRAPAVVLGPSGEIARF